MADDCSKKLTPWKNGYYHSRGIPSRIYYVEGEHIIMYSASGKPSNVYDNPRCKGTWTYGDFGDAQSEIALESGKSRYDVKMTTSGLLCPSDLVLSNDGKRLYFYGAMNCVDVLEWMSEEEFNKFIESGDSADAMPHQYKEQPENQGKLVWLSGASNLGKSTTAQLLAKKRDYVYYEADSFMNHTNPYVPTEVSEPTLAMFGQNFLKEVPQDRIDAVADGADSIKDLMQGRDYDFIKYSTLYNFMCKDIAREQNRIGGNFVIAHALTTRKIREHVRSHLGQNLIFVILHMSKEDQLARVKIRHGEEASYMIDALTKSYELFEVAAEDEPNAINIHVTKEMTRYDVANKIICLLNDECK